MAVKREGQSSLGRPSLASWLYKLASKKCRRGRQSRASVTRFIQAQGLLHITASGGFKQCTLCNNVLARRVLLAMAPGSKPEAHPSEFGRGFTFFLSPPLPCSGVQAGPYLIQHSLPVTLGAVALDVPSSWLRRSAFGGKRSSGDSRSESPRPTGH